jgi:hypothetical protein
MSIQVEVKPSFKMAPAGQFQAVCAEVIDLGHSQKTYRNDQGVDETKTIHEIQYIFQLNKVDDETGKRFTVRSKPFNLMLSEKSNLRAFLLAWRGHDLTDAELKPPGVDVDLTNRNAIISVVHNKVGDKTYANIGAIMPLLENTAPITVLDYEPQGDAVREARAKAAVAGGPNGQPQATVGQPATAPVVDAISQATNGHAAGCECPQCKIPF